MFVFTYYLLHNLPLACPTAGGCSNVSYQVFLVQAVELTVSSERGAISSCKATDSNLTSDEIGLVPLCIGRRMPLSIQLRRWRRDQPQRSVLGELSAVYEADSGSPEAVAFILSVLDPGRGKAVGGSMTVLQEWVLEGGTDRLLVVEDRDVTESIVLVALVTEDAYVSGCRVLS